jgi:hypothetical protein
LAKTPRQPRNVEEANQRMVELRAIERDIARTERIHDQSIAAIEKALEKALQAKERSLKPLRARRQKMESQLQRFGLRCGSGSQRQKLSFWLLKRR